MINENLLEGNKYFKWYWSICNRAKDRVLSPDIYVEKHHIYPKSIYGQNLDLVKLTAKEHYIVHLLLWWGLRSKFGIKDVNTIKMANAFNCMYRIGKNQDRINMNSNKYELQRMANSEASKNRIITDEARKNMSNSGKKRYNGELGEYYRQKRSIETSGEKNGMYGKSAYDVWVEKYGIEEADKRIKDTNYKKSINHQPSFGENNGMYGKNPYNIVKEKYGEEYAKDYEKKRLENHKNKTSNKYKILCPNNDIIEIISKRSVREYLKCTNYFFYKKEFNGYKLISIDKPNDSK